MKQDEVKILIVDDEVIIAESIKLFLIQMGYVDIRMAHDLQSATEVLASWNPDAVLLDIYLEREDDGIIMGKMVHELQTPFMYITANTDNSTTQKVLETHPSGFIAKPIRFNEFKINVHILMQQLDTGLSQIVRLCNGSESFQFEFNALNYIMSDGNYVEIYLDDKRQIIRNSLDKCIQEINSKKFLRIHRSYAVSMDKVTRVTATTVELADVILPLSRSYQHQIKEANNLK